MAQPTNKSPEIEEFLNSTFKDEKGNPLNRRQCIENDICSWCKGPATEFRGELFRREYSISGLCQKCQDETFGIDEEEI